MKYLILTLLFFIENISSILIKNGFAKIKLNVTDTYNINKNECREVKIPNNYKKLILNIRSNNLDRVLITDQKIEKCSDPLSLASCCLRNSTFCIENLNPTKNDFNLNYCIDYTYLYACKNNFTNSSESTNTQPANITITTNIIRGQGCQTTENIPEATCSSIGLNSCKDSQKCTPECSYVECRHDEFDPSTRVFAMCLPSSYSNSDIISKCTNHVKFVNSQPEFYKFDCSRSDDDMNSYNPADSSHSFFKFLLVILGVVLIATFITSVFYRFKLSMDGVPPFEPPAIFPEFIFPRQAGY
jgi:hypothetical protein